METRSIALSYTPPHGHNRCMTRSAPFPTQPFFAMRIPSPFF